MTALQYSKSSTLVTISKPAKAQNRHSSFRGNPVVQTVYLAVEIKGMTVLG